MTRKTSKIAELCGLAAVLPLFASAVAAATTAGSEGLPEILAKVNNKSIHRATVIAGLNPDDPVGPALDRAVCRALSAQLAVREGLDKDPAYVAAVRDMKMRSGRTDDVVAMILASHYIQTNADLQKAFAAAAAISDAEVDAFIAENQPRYGQMPKDQLRPVATRGLVSQRRAEIRNDWVMPRLSKTEFSIDGTPIPATVIEAAVDARATGNGDPLIDHILASLPGAANDPAGALGAAVIDAGGTAIELGTLRGFQQIAAGAGGGQSHRKLIDVLIHAVLAAEARSKGIDQDPEFIRANPLMGPQVTNADTILVAKYFEHHELKRNDIKIDKKELDQFALAVMQMFQGKGDGALRRQLAAAKKSYVDAAVSDAEIEALSAALMLSLWDGRDAFRAYLVNVMLEWKVAGHFAPLLAQAKIKRFDD